jgi:type VI secretion system ImpC/EvpB family protein
MCLNGTANRYGIVPVTERPNDTFDPVYERTVHGASETVRLPFSIAVLADLGDRYPLSLSDRRLIKLDVENFHRVLAHLTPEIQFQVDSPDSELPDFKIPCQLQFRSLDDFDPYSVIEQVDVLRALSRNEELSFGIDFRDLLASVIDHEKFQKASSIWHALFDFVSMIQKNEYCDVYVLNVSKRRVFKDLTKSVELDQTTLFKRLCLEQMGTAGGAPIGLVIADFSVGSHPDDLELIQKLSAVCAAGHMALLTEAREDLVFCNAWDDLDREFDPEWLVNFSRLEKFGSLRQREDAGSLALCAPGLRYRIPSPSSPPLHGSVAPWVPPLVRDVARKIRINPAYAVAAKVARQFHGSGRHASVSGELTWQHMPHTPGADSGEGEGRTPSMVALEAEGHFDAAIAAKLQRLGVNAVITDSGACTLHLPRIRTARDFRGPLDGPPAESNPSADLGARLYADRIIHYLSAFERDHLRDLPLERWHTTAMQYLTEYFYLPSETDDRDVGRRLGKISIALTPRAPWLRSCQKNMIIRSIY